MKKVLVTGGAGFIGSNFCNLFSDKYQITAIDNLLLGDPENLNSKTKFIKGDAGNIADLQKCGDDFDVILHFAGTSSAPMFDGEKMPEAHRNSLQSFVQSLEWARKCGAKKFLFASTSSIYGNQKMPLAETNPIFATNHYSVSKIFYEHATEIFQKVNPEIDTIGFRFMSVYGPNEEAKGRYANLISQFIWDATRGKTSVIFGDGEQTRDFTNVRDICAAIDLAIEKPNLGYQIFNIGTGKSSNLNEMLAIISENLGREISPKYIPNPVRENYILGQCADISKISSVLGFAPKITLEEGIADQIKNLRPEKIRETSSDFFR